MAECLVTKSYLQDCLPVPNTGRISGWVHEPSFRGTWQILWSCLVTIFLCTHTLLCLNIPAPTDTWFSMVRRRIKWMVLAILGPEIVLTYAAGQWSRARHSVEYFHKSGYTQWTMRLAFFADMGGFVLHAKDSDPFPLNAKHLHWLIKNKHVDYPCVNAAEIWDKSKQDRLTKVITAIQVGHLVVECIGRVAQGLAVTALELNTLAIVVCSLMTAFAWLHKPADVRTPISIVTDKSIADITENRAWKNTPLDFVDENGPGWSINVQPFMRMPATPANRPIQCIPNDRFPMNPYGIQEYCVCFATLLFTGLHIAGWNFSFPTQLERTLWRVTSLILFGVTAAFWALETVASWVRLGRWKWLYLRFFHRERLSEFEAAQQEKLDQERSDKQPTELPLPWEFWTIMPIAVLYGVARFYQIIEAFAELREVDATAFVNVNWSVYFPHI
ncbi:hypothetical protein BGZ61DRAFT_462822 [Ilyonectria robusta]|uniref:uncharacterized protein n=1 Tax=Ilyonectria robusta TaxID=1079257 RepID=UPI001E8E638E|nr:uncharacterized protein BGZ61DRAFT_462822 [Ilyonectria robusta]KAH8663284.1 hypothetical protein BGZ61DRAFT_462822 [Ilyonectria robusta]